VRPEKKRDVPPFEGISPLLFNMFWKESFSRFEGIHSFLDCIPKIRKIQIPNLPRHVVRIFLFNSASCLPLTPMVA
jgi:hypothetical protein